MGINSGEQLSNNPPDILREFHEGGPAPCARSVGSPTWIMIGFDMDPLDRWTNEEVGRPADYREELPNGAFRVWNIECLGWRVFPKGSGGPSYMEFPYHERLKQTQEGKGLHALIHRMLGQGLRVIK
jgi:hypothetical protein